jgi:hypothetical protein
MLHARKDYQQIQDPSGKIPEDEPVFLLRAQDQLAILTLREWCRWARYHNVDPHMVKAAEAQITRMQEWRKHHHKQVKLPDMNAEDVL